MDEQDFREGLTVSELQERAIIIPLKVTGINLIQWTIVASKELDKTFDQLACV